MTRSSLPARGLVAVVALAACGDAPSSAPPSGPTAVRAPAPRASAAGPDDAGASPRADDAERAVLTAADAPECLRGRWSDDERVRRRTLREAMSRPEEAVPFLLRVIALPLDVCEELPFSCDDVARVLCRHRDAAASEVVRIVAATEPPSWSYEVLPHMAEYGGLGRDERRILGEIVRWLDDAQRRDHALEILTALGPAASEATPALLRLLASAPREDVDDVVRALGAVRGDPDRVVPALVEELDAERWAVLHALEGYGPAASAAVDALAARAVDPRTGEASSAVVETLAAIGPPAEPHLLALLRREHVAPGVLDALVDAPVSYASAPLASAVAAAARDGDTTNAALRILGRWAETDAAAAAEHERLAPPSPLVAEPGPAVRAAESGRLPDALVPEFADACLGLRGEAERRRAVAALADEVFALDAPAWADVDRRAIAESLAAWRDESDPRWWPTEHRWTNVRAARRLGGRGPEAWRELLQGTAGHPDYALAEWDADLCAIGPSADALVAAALHDESAAARTLAALTVQWLAPQRARDLLPRVLELLADRDPSVRAAALRAASRIAARAPRLAEAVVPLLADADDSVRPGAAAALWRLAGDVPRALPVLAAALAEPQETYGPLDPHRTAADAVRDMGAAAAPALDDLRECLRTEQLSYVWVAVLDTLGEIGPAAAPAVPDVARALRGGLPENSMLESISSVVYRVPAARALGRIGPAASAAIPDLERAAMHPDASLRAAARDALRAIRGVR